MQHIAIAKGLTVKLQGGPVLIDDTSFAFEKGKITGLSGASGSGKSMLAWIFLGLQPDIVETKGEIRFSLDNNSDINVLDKQQAGRLRGSHISLIPQNPYSSLNPTIPCGKQIAETGNVPVERVYQHLGDIGFEAPERIASAYPHELSGGQLQRVVIAMATINDPVLLLADEPVTSLDSVTGMIVLETLRKWVGANTSRSLLLISHNQEAISFMCDHHYVLEEKQIHIVQSQSNGKSDRSPGNPDRESSEGELTGDSSPETGVLLEVRELSVEFRSRSRIRAQEKVNALSGVSFIVAPREKLAIVGASGSGKTTIARVIAGLVTPHEGELLLNGTDMDYLAKPALRGQVQLIFQDPYSSLYPNRTVRYILAEVLARHQGRSFKGNDTILSQILDEVQLPAEYLDKYPWQLSGGERQRVQIARAIAVDPTLLICDECVTGLDKPVQGRILELLDRLSSTRGLTLLFITHDLKVASQLCDSCIVMSAGRIVERSSISELLVNPSHPASKALIEAWEKMNVDS